MTTFNDLPLLVKSQIFKNLEVEDKKAARLVCKDWSFTIDKYASIFTYNDVPFANNNYQHVLNAGVPIKGIKVLSFTNNLSFSSTRRGNFIPDVESLTFSTTSHDCKYNGANGCVNGTSGINMQKILDRCPQIKCLRFRRSAFVNVGNSLFLKNLKLEELQTLEIEIIGNFNSRQHTSVQSLTMCHFSRLTTLILRFSFVRKYCIKHYFNLYLGICSFIASHEKTLKSLIFVHPDNLALQPQRKRVCKCKMHPDTMMIFGGLENVSLQQLELGTPDVEISMPLFFPLGTYEMKLALAQTSLQTLTLSGSHELSSEELENLLLTNKSTLQKFDISDLKLEHSILLDISWLKDARELRQLALGSSTTVVNITYLPKSLTSLNWRMQSDDLETDDLLWIVCNLKQLERLTLKDFNEDQNAGRISVEIFHYIVTLLPRLQFLHLNCRHQARKIKSFIEERIKYCGERYHYCTDGRIYILRSN